MTKRNNNHDRKDLDRSIDLVSVIVSTYNRLPLLKKCIESILNQTYSNIEIIVSDDGSSDGTKEYMLQQMDNKKIVYVECEHTGLPSITRNMGIKKAKGNWLAFCDDDDEWNITKIESQLFLLKRENVEACCTNAKIMLDGEIMSDTYFKNDSKILNTRDFFGVNPVIYSSMMVSKDIIEKCGCFSEDEEFKGFENYTLWLKVSLFTKIYYTKHTFVKYLITSNSSVRKTNNIDFSEQKTRIIYDTNKWKKNIVVYYYSKRIERLQDVIKTYVRKVKKCIKKILKKI